MITNIKNAYIGDSSVSRLYQGDQLIYDAGHPDILLKWIANGPDDGEGTPNVYFDTGFTPKLSTKAEIKYECSTVQVGRLFGCGNATNSATQYWINMYAAGNTPEGTSKTSIKFAYRGQDIAASFTPQANTPYTVTVYGTYSGDSASAVNMIINGTTYSRSRTISSNISSASSAYIFATHGSSPEGPNSASGVKVYYCKMWQDNNLIRFYIPVLHWTNNQYVPCFYDKVNDSYIYNLGTDDVTYKITDDYVLDYLANGPDNGSANPNVYFDTGYTPQLSTKAEFKFETPTVANGRIFGCGQSSTANSMYNFNIYANGNIPAGTTFNSMKFFYRNANVVSSDAVVTNTPYTVVLYGTYSGNSASAINMNINGTTYTRSMTATSNITGASDAYIFRWNGYDGGIETPSGVKFYYLNMSNDNFTVRNYIPVLHNDRACFLDLNSNTYIYNLGTDTPSYSF